MNIDISILKQKNYILDFIKKEIVLIIAISLALISSFLNVPKVEYIDFKVLILLFNLMIVVSSFNNLKVLDTIAISMLRKCTTYTSISFAIVILTFLFSMIVTNDVALITFVPLTIIIGKKANFNTMKLVIFQTIAANLGSSFTPMGNPQNLFIYSYFNLSVVDFFNTTFILMFLGIIFLAIILLREKNKVLSFTLEDIRTGNPIHILIFSVLFFIIILSVFHIVNYKITFYITLLTVFLTNKKLFIEVDYSLLLTFIGFFIFIGNISTLASIKAFMSTMLSSKESTYLTSIFLSQGISNVPATMLLSNFTAFYKELLLGVNIGGLGTLIASLASVISYKLYIKECEDDSTNYIKVFTFYNIIGLILLVPSIYILSIML